MNKKIFENARFCHKGDTEANWNKAVGFVPLDKEIIIYKKDDTHPAARFKVGDGKTVVQELPFSGTDMEAIEKLIDEKGELLIEYVDNAVAEAVEQLNSEIPTNLKNGHGTDSLVQVYTGEIDDTHYGNTTTGDSSVAFGEANQNSAQRALICGKLNSNDGANALVGGFSNTNKETGALMSGYKNINKGPNSTVGGRENKNYSEASSVIGSGNTNGVESNTNESYGSNVYGGGNTNTAKYASVGGSGNTNDGSSAIVGGQNNNNTGGRTIVGGMGNTNGGHDTIVVGKGLKNRHENLSVFGKYNDNKSVNLLEIGNGKDAEHPSNAFEVLKDGRAKSYGAPVESNDVVRKLELDKKFDKAGGTISGNVFVQGNLTISGETTTLDTVTLQVKDNVIVANADGAELVENAGFAMKTSATAAYGIMYDPVGDGVKIGLGAIDKSGKFNYTEGEDQFLATRASTITNGHTVVWDDENKTLIDSGVGHNEYVKKTDYATNINAGVIMATPTYGSMVNAGHLQTAKANKDEILAKGSGYKPIVPNTLDYAVKVGITTNTETWTDEDKAKACETIGALKKPANPSRDSIVNIQVDGTVCTTAMVHESATPWSIPLRDNYGRIKVATPGAASDATTKGYVDGKFVAKDTVSSNGVYGKSAGNEILYSVSQLGAGGGEDSIARRTNKGGLRVFLDETSDKRDEMATPRGYVDGKADALSAEIAVINLTLEQSGLVKKYKQPITQEYTERVTADGANVLDGSKAVLKKVVGNTVACKNLIDLTTVDTPTLNNVVYRRIELNLPIGDYTIAFDKGVYWQREGSGVNRTAAAADKTLFNITITDTEDAWINVRMVESSTTPWDYTNKFWVFVGTYSKDTMPPYQPYFTGLKSASFGGIESGGKNLFDTSFIKNRTYANGSSVTVNSDGSIHVVKKAGDAINFNTKTNFPAGTYTLSNGLTRGSEVYFTFANAYTISTPSHTITFKGGEETLYLFSPPNVEDDVVLKPQFEHGTTATEYTPYISPYLFDFPKTEMPLGKTIDFESKKVTDYGVEVVLTGNEPVYSRGYLSGWNTIYVIGCLPTKEAKAQGICTDGNVIFGTGSWIAENTILIGNNNKDIHWCGILEKLGYATKGAELSAEEMTGAIANFKSYLAQRYADGNPVTIRYVSSTLQKETDFTADNEYTAYKGGTEKVLENDGNEYGADNMLTQDYILVTEVK